MNQDNPWVRTRQNIRCPIDGKPCDLHGTEECQAACRDTLQWMGAEEAPVEMVGLAELANTSYNWWNNIPSPMVVGSGYFNSLMQSVKADMQASLERSLWGTSPLYDRLVNPHGHGPPEPDYPWWVKRFWVLKRRKAEKEIKYRWNRHVKRHWHGVVQWVHDKTVRNGNAYCNND